MSELEVVDPTQEYKELAPCFGTWDENFKECIETCELRERCKTHKRSAAKPRPPVPTKETIEELPEMDPKDYLIESLKGRYDLESKTQKSVTIISCRKDGKPVIQVRITDSGRYLMVAPSTGLKLQIDKIESVRQAAHIFDALLVV